MQSISRLAAVLLLLFCVAAQARQQDAIESVDVDRHGPAPRIEVRLGAPMQYLSHVPQGRGSELQVRLRPAAAGAVAELSPRHAIAWRPSAAVPLTEVRFEAEGAQAVLTLTFNREVSWSLAAGGDFRTLSVVLEEAVVEPETLRETSAAAPAYAINLMSGTEAIAREDIVRARQAADGTVYVTPFERDGQRWYRLRAGFFPSRERAEQARQVLAATYPDAWTVQVAPEELAAAEAGLAPQVEAHSAADDATEALVGGLMEQARLAMLESAFNDAIALYSRVLAYPGHSRSREALELLGLARERNGQGAQAKAVYESYLERYPQGADAERVRQRLVTLITASLPERPKLREARAARGEGGWETYGSLAQFYLYDHYSVDGDYSDTQQSAISSDVDLVARRRGDDGDLRIRVSASHYKDLLGSEGPGDDVRISSAYVERSGRGAPLSFRVGRQTSHGDGTLGRYDGIKLGHRVGATAQVNVVAGYPVASTRDTVETGRRFLGASADLGALAEAWELSLFGIEQHNAGLIDRRAVGAEARYFRPGRTFLGYIDYDLHYAELNTALLLGTWTLEDETTLNATLDVRKSPVLTTSNALQGQPVTDLEGLGTLYTEDQIYDLARDRTATSRSLTLGLSRPLHERLRLNGDVTVSSLSATETSGGVDAYPASGNQYFYNLQLVGSDLLKPGDISSLGLRFSATGSADTASLYASSRYPVDAAWRLGPKLRIDRRSYDNGDTQWTLAPALRIENRWKRSTSFEADLGGEWTTRSLPAQEDERTTAWYGSLGYRYDF